MQGRSVKWTDEQTEQLKALHRQKLSCSLIAERMGGVFTRNAIIGRLHRLGLSNSTSVVHKDEWNLPKFRPKKKNRKTVRIVRSNGNSNGFRVMESAETDLQELRCVEVVPRMVALVDLKPGECRYPYGDGPFAFCGHARFEGHSYCAPHAILTRTETRVLSEATREKRRRTMRASFRFVPVEAA